MVLSKKTMIWRWQPLLKDIPGAGLVTSQGLFGRTLTYKFSSKSWVWSEVVELSKPSFTFLVHFYERTLAPLPFQVELKLFGWAPAPGGVELELELWQTGPQFLDLHWRSNGNIRAQLIEFCIFTDEWNTHILFFFTWTPVQCTWDDIIRASPRDYI